MSVQITSHVDKTRIHYTLFLGVVLLGIGILGSLNNGWMGFGLNALNQWIHILAGIAAIGAVFAGDQYTKIFCLAFGALFGLLALAGFIGLEPVKSGMD